NGLGGRLGVFTAYEFERYDKDITPFEAGYTSDQHGAIFGIDYRFDNFLIGAAGHFTKQIGRYDDGGGKFFQESGGGTIYASLFPVERMFVDIAATYNKKDYEFIRHVEVFTGAALLVSGNHRGVTDGHEFRLSANGGYDFQVGPATVGPRVGFNY